MRQQTWDVDLMAFIESRRKTLFRWGVHDCTMFAADCALAMTSMDPARLYRGSYSTQRGASRIIGRFGSLRGLVNANMGPEIPILMARRGDWVMIQQDGREALGVCIGAKIVAAGVNGLVQLPLAEGITAWRVE